LWDARERLRPHREPEILRVDLARPVLEVLAWGCDPERFVWFEAPPPDGVAAAIRLLESLGAVESRRRLTPVGEALRRLPLHPRLGALLLRAGASARAAAACALLAEGEGLMKPAPTTSCDLLVLADEISRASPGVQRIARELHEQARALRFAAGSDEDEEAALRRAVLAAYPDRVARRRERDGTRLLLTSGQGAVLARESGVHEGDFLVAVDLAAGVSGADPLVRLASRVEREWLTPTHREVEYRSVGREVRALECQWYGKVLLSEKPVPPDPVKAREIKIAALRAERLPPEGDRLLRRARFAGVPLDVEELLGRIVDGAGLKGAESRDLDQLAPETIVLPSGRRAEIEYAEDGRPSLSVKLQELFGLADTPRIGPRKEPLLVLLLSPSGRPVQTTRDLRSFWEKTYPEVRRELRGRYPRHPWPEDPWTATPTARAKRRR
jgi:ATP-dependent helicase HrpB